MNRNILVIDDNLTICLMLKSWLIKKGFNVETASDGNEAKQMVRESPYDLILSDIRMPKIDGLTFLGWVQKYDSEIIVIMMTEFADIESAVASMKLGAVDYISKPIDPEILFKKIEEAFQRLQNIKKHNPFSLDFLYPPGNEHKQLVKQLNHIAENNHHALIIGDRGSGKASSVKYIYGKAFLASKPFIILDTNDFGNQGAVINNFNDESTLLAERFEAAREGLLYIREIDRLSRPAQDNLLSLIRRQKKDDCFTQLLVSSDKSRESIENLIIPKLFALLEKECLVLPSLRGRKQDIIFYASHFLNFANFTLNREVDNIDNSMLQLLVEYEWPGNIQELKNIIIKAVLLTDGRVITTDIAPQLFGNEKALKSSRLTKKSIESLRKENIESLRKENYEKEKISQALELAKGNKTMAASILNIDRKTLYNKIKLYSIDV